jgi:hypothetical protein
MLYRRLFVLVSSSVSTNFTLLLLKAALQTTTEVKITLCIAPQYCPSDKCACTETEFTQWSSLSREATSHSAGQEIP